MFVQITKVESCNNFANMTNINECNTYFGPDSLKKYFDPDSQPPLPLVELPPHLNPYYKDGVRIYAKMMTMHPANNVKAMPGMKSYDCSLRYWLTCNQR
jgi:cysteine synthase A